MNAGIQRRLARLEGSAGASGMPDIAAIIEATRKRVRYMTEEEWLANQAAGLADMERRHAEQPFRGPMLRLLEGKRRSTAARAAEVAP